MYIKEIALKNFRNYEEEKADFLPGTCIIQGANGQGKSNLLEAIYNLCFARSFRNLKESDLVCWNKPFYYLQGTIYLQKRFFKVELGYDLLKKRKVMKINGKPARQFRLAEHCGRFLAGIWSLSEEVRKKKAFSGRGTKPGKRSLCGFLSRYNRAVYQKNRVLKEKKLCRETQDLIRPWNRQIVYFGSRIIQMRAHVLSIWSKLASYNYNVLFQNDQKMKIVYNNIIGENAGTAEIEEIEEAFANKLALWENEEWKRGFSLLGPHRDDLTFLLDGREARRFASHGQQRSAVIALKAAQIQLYSEKKEKPLFILDDVFSELDEQRKKQCFLLLHNAEQVFLTVTEKDSFLDSFLEKMNCTSFLQIREGKIREEKRNAAD